MTKTLFHADLIVRDFGMAAVRVVDLLRWSEQIGATLPATDPDVEGFELAHLETLLCAIERAVPGMPDRAVMEIAATIPCDEKIREMINEGDAQLARWLVGANVHLQWRQRLQDGIDAGDLQPVDALSGIRMEARRAAADNPPAASDLATLATPAELVDAFPQWLKREWFDNLSDRAWLRKARRHKGKSGRSGAPPLFCPYAVMMGLMKSTRSARLPEARGWHILRQRFPEAHDAHEHERPRTRPSRDDK